ncbi:ATP-dependent RNA helicase DbpA [Bordetella trematum]|nr:ATP-dependent RNA helicase DbpA [Bordetella trematum]
MRALSAHSKPMPAHTLWADTVFRACPIVTDTSFSSLPLLPALLENLQSLGFERMTPIQAQSLPLILEGAI